MPPPPDLTQVVADGGLSETREFDWSDCGKAVEPAEWHETVDDPNTIVLDCRNEFESEVRVFVVYVLGGWIDRAIPRRVSSQTITTRSCHDAFHLPPPHITRSHNVQY